MPSRSRVLNTSSDNRPILGGAVAVATDHSSHRYAPRRNLSPKPAQNLIVSASKVPSGRSTKQSLRFVLLCLANGSLFLANQNMRGHMQVFTHVKIASQ